MATPEAESATVTPENVRVEMPAQYLDELSDADAMAKMKGYIAEQHALSQMGVKRLVLPVEHRHLEQTHAFVRVGAKSSPKWASIGEAMRYILREQGWRDAPPGTFDRIYGAEGTQGVYMMIPKEAKAMRDEYDRVVRRRLADQRLSRKSSDLGDLSRAQGVQIENVEIQRGTSSYDDFMKSTKSPRR